MGYDLQEIMASSQVIAKEISEGQKRNQVTIWATSQAEFRKDLKDAGIADEEWAYRENTTLF